MRTKKDSILNSKQCSNKCNLPEWFWRLKVVQNSVLIYVIYLSTFTIVFSSGIRKIHVKIYLNMCIIAKDINCIVSQRCRLCHGHQESYRRNLSLFRPKFKLNAFFQAHGVFCGTNVYIYSRMARGLLLLVIAWH